MIPAYQLTTNANTVFIAMNKHGKRITAAELVDNTRCNKDQVGNALRELRDKRLIKECAVKGRYNGRERKQYEVVN
jgi:DNA-binding transcriptional regulator GbsR (MarR family)